MGWRSGRKTKLGQLSVGAEVAAVLRDVVSAALADLADRSPEPWAPDADLSQETYLTMHASGLGDAPTLAAEHQGLSLVNALLAAEALPVLHPEELSSPHLGFYAITVGDTPGERALLLRRTNPRRGLKRGRMMTCYSDVLKRIEKPVFAFNELIDLVFLGERVFVLSQTAFIALFRSQETLMAQVAKWTSELAVHVGITKEGQQWLSAKAIRDSRAKTRLEAIVKRGHGRRRAGGDQGTHE